MTPDLAQKILSANQTSYNAMAQKFSSSRKREWAVMKELVDQYIVPSPESRVRVLDLGCGDGRLLKLLPPGVDYLGVDSSAELIGLAQKQYPSGHFLLKDILNLDFKQEFPGGAGPTESWDAVLAFAVISHLPTVELRQQALTKIFEALRPGGVVILTCWNFWRLTRREKSIWRYKIFERNRNREWGMGNEEWGMRNGDSGLRFKDIMTYFQDGDKKYPLYYYAYTLGELRRQVRKSGFKIVETYYEKDGQKTSWGRGYNLVVVGRKMV